MDWGAIAAVGEILGAVAVVVTLLYLAKQIRQSSKAVEVTALRDSTDHWNHWSELVASSPGLAEIVARGNRSYDAARVIEVISSVRVNNIRKRIWLLLEHVRS